MPTVSVVTVNRSSSITSESDYLAMVNAPGTDPVITPETSFLVSTLEETCYASPVLNTESVADILIDLEERGMVVVPEVEAVETNVMPSREELEELVGKVDALKNAQKIKDTEMKEMRAAYEAQIVNLKDKQSSPVPIVPMPIRQVM